MWGAVILNDSEESQKIRAFCSARNDEALIFKEGIDKGSGEWYNEIILKKFFLGVSKMKALKKILLGGLSVACVASASVGFSGCQSDATDGLIYYPLSDGTYAVAQGTAKYSDEIVIPSSYNGKAVTRLAEEAFSGSNAQTIVIPDSVTSIGDSAFRNCGSLTSVVIGDSVTSIDGRAFYNCSSLTSIEIPDSVTSIGGSAFSNCSSLTSIEIPDSVTSIGSGAFFDCRSLTSVVIGDSVKSIGGGAFYYCSSLTSVVIPDSVTSISN